MDLLLKVFNKRLIVGFKGVSPDTFVAVKADGTWMIGDDGFVAGKALWCPGFKRIIYLAKLSIMFPDGTDEFVNRFVL
jgi:hypothetical protein